MLKTPVQQIIWLLCATSLAAILMLLPVHAFISTWGGTSIGPLLVWKSWKEILLLVLLLPIGFYLWRQPELAKLLWHRRVNQLIVAYFALHICFAIFSGASMNAVVAGLLMNLRFFAVFLLAQLVTEANPQWVTRFKSWLPTWLLWVMAGLGVLAVLQMYVLPSNFLDAFGYSKDTIAAVTLVDDNPNALRAFATLRGPNTLGAFLLLPLGVALYMFVRRQKVWLAGAAGLLGLVALFLSGSRSAWLGCAVMFGVLGFGLLPQARRRQWLRLAILPVVAVGIIGAWAAVNVPAVRLAVFHSSPGDPSLTEGSSDKHWQATMAGVQDVLAHPLGQGVGTAGPASFYNDAGADISENYFVQIAQEVGVLGLGLLVGAMVLAIGRLGAQTGMMPQVLVASFMGLTVINMLLHGWADDPTAMTWWAVAGLYVARQQKQ